MHPAALPRRAHELLRHGRFQARVGIGYDQVHPGQPAGLERAQEVAPELVRFAVSDGGAEHFAGAVDGDSGGHDHGVRDQVRPDADLAEGGIGEHVWELRMGQRAGAKRLDLGVQVGTDAGDLGLGDAGVDSQGADQVVDSAGGDSVDVGLHDHRVQGPVDPAATLEQGRKERPRSQLGDTGFDVPGRGRDRLGAVAVAMGCPAL